MRLKQCIRSWKHKRLRVEIKSLSIMRLKRHLLLIQLLYICCRNQKPLNYEIETYKFEIKAFTKKLSRNQKPLNYEIET